MVQSLQHVVQQNQEEQQGQGVPIGESIRHHYPLETHNWSVYVKTLQESNRRSHPANYRRFDVEEVCNDYSNAYERYESE